VLGYSGGHASEAQSPTIEAENDSIVDAFYLLKFDYEVLGARMASESKMDSLRIADIQAQLMDARKQRYRDLGVFGIAVVTAGLIFYLGGRAAQ
jgi:hypothetical protein